MTKKNGRVIILAVISLIILILGCVFFLSEKQLSLEETFPPETEAKILFSENFENGSKNWNLEEGWALEKIDGNTVLRGGGHRWARLKDKSWDNYTFKARFKIIQGTIHFNYRHNEFEGPYRYFSGVSRDGLYLNRQIGDEFGDLANIHIVGTMSKNLENQWHEIEIRGYEDIINIRLDGKLYVAYKDEKPILAGGIAFETLEESVFLIDDVEIRKSSVEDIVTEPTPEQISGISFVPDITHSGHLVVAGKETKIIEDVKYFQQGNIYVNDEAKLVVRNSQLMIGPGEVVPTVHCYIFVSDKASLEIENSTVFPEDGLVVIETSGKVNITNSPTKIHIVSVNEGAQVTIANSEVLNPIGGLIEVHGGDTRIINSTIGAVSIGVPANSWGEIRGLKSGIYLESWDIHRDLGISGIPYNLTLEKVSILKDTLPPGGFERGWIFEIHSEAEVKISDSELRKVYIFFENEKINLENLKINSPVTLKHKDIESDNITVKGEWGIFLYSSNIKDVTIKNSDSLFIIPSGQLNINLTDSHMMEFIPTDFFGTINFKNCVWRDEGEIIGGTPYHSMGNNFTIKGSLKLEGVRANLRWKDAQVTREYDVIVRDENGNPIEGALIKIDEKTFVSDNAGKAKFSLIFNEFNYNEPKNLDVLDGENLIIQKEIDFFTETPIIIIKD